MCEVKSDGCTNAVPRIGDGLHVEGLTRQEVHATEADQREFIAQSDYEGLVDLLIACGHKLSQINSVRPLVEKLWGDKRFVVGA